MAFVGTQTPRVRAGREFRGPFKFRFIYSFTLSDRRSAGSSKYQAHGPASRELTGEERERPPN